MSETSASLLAAAETKVPAVPAALGGNLLDVAKALKQIIDVREGLVGNPLDANLTFRDLLDAGAVTIRPGWSPVRKLPGGSSPIMPIWADPDGYDPTTDFTPHPNLSTPQPQAYLQWFRSSGKA